MQRSPSALLPIVFEGASRASVTPGEAYCDRIRLGDSAVVRLVHPRQGRGLSRGASKRLTGPPEEVWTFDASS